MGIIIKQEDNRSELQKRVAATLTDKAKKKLDVPDDLPDGVDDSAYIEGTRQTTSLAWIWILLALIVIVVMIVFFLMGGKQL